MHLLIVTFKLNGVSDADYRASCDAEAPAFADVPGLVSKAWLADEPSNTYGGVYTFVDRQSMDAYIEGDLFKSIATDASLANVTTKSFEILERPSRVTRVLPVAAA